MARASAVILDHELILGMEATHSGATRQKLSGIPALALKYLPQVFLNFLSKPLIHATVILAYVRTRICML